MPAVKKSDEAKALDSFLEMKDMRNMRFECADTDEGKKGMYSVTFIPEI